MNRAFPATLIGLIALGACGGSSGPSPPESPGPGSGEVIQISGRERFGWTQAADNILNFHFAVYVDNTRVELPSTMCRPSTAGLFDCDSPLPPLKSGRHTLEVVSVITANGQTVESPRAPALNVNVTGNAASADDVAMSASSLPPGSSPAATHASAGCGLVPLSPQAFAMWDESGAIRLFDQRSRASRAVTWKADPQWTLSGLAPHPKFAENKLLYLVETPASRDSMLRLSRYREVGGVLGERAVLLETRVGSTFDRTSAFFESDGYLSVALLSSAPPPIDDRTRRNEPFLLRVTDAGLPAPGNRPGSVFGPVSAPTPIAVAWSSGNDAPWVLTRVSADAYTVTQLGQTDADENRLYPASVPVAMQVEGIGNQQMLYITGSRGDVRRLAGDGMRWSVRDGFRLFDNARSIRDALVLSDGEVAACGPVNGSGYGVWRVRLP